MSRNFTKVKRYYDSGRWNAAQVELAVGRWITEEEYHLIVVEDETEPE